MLHFFALRYVKVCCSSFHSRFFSKRTALLFLLLIWTAVFVAFIPTFITEDSVYDSSLEFCIINICVLPTWYLIMGAILVFFPVFLCCVFYFLVLRSVRQSKRRIRGSRSRKNDSHSFSRSDISLFKTVFIVLAAYLISCFPRAVMTICMNLNFYVANEPFKWIANLVFCNSVVHGFIHGKSNRKFRNGYTKCISLIRRKCKH